MNIIYLQPEVRGAGHLNTLHTLPKSLDLVPGEIFHGWLLDRFAVNIDTNLVACTWIKSEDALDEEYFRQQLANRLADPVPLPTAARVLIAAILIPAACLAAYSLAYFIALSRPVYGSKSDVSQCTSCNRVLPLWRYEPCDKCGGEFKRGMRVQSLADQFWKPSTWRTTAFLDLWIPPDPGRLRK